MNKLLRPSTLFFLAVFAFLVWKQGPQLLRNSKLQGGTLPSQTYQHAVATDQGPVTFPMLTKRTLLIFWASWCGPCMVEMDRLSQSVESGKISRTAIFAVNPFESPEVVREFYRKKPLPFTFLDASPLARRLQISATPTTVLMDGTVIRSVKMGMSVTGIYEAEQFLAGPVTAR